MTDLTPLFEQCVQIVSTGLSLSRSNESVPESKPSTYVVKDTFIKESSQFYDVLTRLNSFTKEVKSQYLAINDEVRNAHNPQGLTNGDKDKIDEEFQSEIQQLYKKLSWLEEYESKRQSRTPSDDTVKGWFENVFGDSQPSEKEVYFSTISQHRNHILKFLMMALNTTNRNFEVIQKKRLIRNKQLDSLNFQNFEEDEFEDYNLNDMASPNISSTRKLDGINNQAVDDLDDFNQQDQLVLQQEEESSAAQDEAQQTLSQEQIQELQQESKEFLKMKTNQLKQVQKVQQSIIDIINIQNDLSFKLTTQEEQISNLLDNNFQMHVHVQQGNKQLTGATSRNKKGANYLVMICIVLGLIILLTDYISF